VAAFMLALLGPTTYGDFVLMRRQRRASGTVISIDESDEVSSPRIGFRDERGRPYEFDSPLGVNRRTGVIGGEVEVIYDPLHPKRAREANRVPLRMLTAVLWYGFAIGLAIFAIAGNGSAAG
jgi:hypothetical protein